MIFRLGLELSWKKRLLGFIVLAENMSKMQEARFNLFNYHQRKGGLFTIEFKDIGLALFLTALCGGIFFIPILIDGISLERLAELLVHADSQTLTDVFGNAFGGMMVGFMALLITVVAFVVQMAATRYTARIVDLFIKNRLNLFYMTLSSVTTVFVILVLYVGDAGKTVPSFSVGLAVVLVSGLLLSIFPYFIFIFNFIKPSNIIYTIEKETFLTVQQAQRRAGQRKAARDLSRYQSAWLAGINQLTDITLNCIQNKDQILAIECLRSLRYLLLNYLKYQASCELSPTWLRPTQVVKMDVAFITLAEQHKNGTFEFPHWPEDKIFKQFELVFRLSLNNDRVICNYLANSLYVIGSLALDLHNASICKRVVMFFNTFLRATINTEDIRTCFNTLNQYRKLAEAFVAAGEGAVAAEIAFYFKYYGLLAYSQKNMEFILETAAHDLCDICKKAFELKLSNQEKILDLFLTVDLQVEGEKHISLRGIRLAQIRLATSYLASQTREGLYYARKIYVDLLEELKRPQGYERIFMLIRELKTSKKEYWEINDREYNFNYLLPVEKKQLNLFLQWFQIRLIILFAYEQRMGHNLAVAESYLEELKAVEKLLPTEEEILGPEIISVLGDMYADTKNSYINNILALKDYLMDDENLLKELEAQTDLAEGLKALDPFELKEGLKLFFARFEKM